MPPLPLALMAWLAGPAAALTLSLQAEDQPYTGVTLRQYRTSNPTTNTWVLLVDLCADRVHIDATKAPSGYASTGSWAQDRGVQAATNGDFYTSGPRVYGDAVGEGVPWPAGQTGTDSGVSGEWYYQHYGWIAFLHDGVEFTHSEWIKQNRSVTSGWEPDTVAPPPPPGTIALVSGFPELVTEGAPFSCSSPTASDCFPDRSDMRDRHPRTAMGITEDRETFILAVVDGRTSSSSGMYGAELAELMHQLGAWEAFNLDGGGSSQMWVSGEGYINDYDGNNSGGGARSVTNHWGVFAGSGSGMPTRAGHCASQAPCGTVPAEGGVIDDDSACFQLFGDMQWWRSEAAGYGSHLYWTNAWQTDQPENWAWWRIHPERAGTYELEVWVEDAFAAFSSAHYEVMAGGEQVELTVDLSGASGWVSLGTYDLDAGGGQWVAVYDDHDGSVASDQHIPADALRLTRIGGGEDTGLEDSDTPDDSEPPDDSDTPETPDDSAAGGLPGSRQRMGSGEGCGGCAVSGEGGASVLWLGLLAVLGAATRRR
jgi:MYXO-CTERM domain-containing protein